MVEELQEQYMSSEIKSHIKSGSNSAVKNIESRDGVARRGEVGSRSALFLLLRIVSARSAEDALVG